MKKVKYLIEYCFAAIIILSMQSCEPTEYDGLNVVDPLPEVSVTFPQAIGWDNRMQMDWNAFTFKESVGDSKVSIQIAVPEKFKITKIAAIRGQRIRGNIGSQVTGGSITGSSRNPSTFDRVMTPNYGTDIAVTPGSVITWEKTLAELNAFPQGSLGPVQVGDGFRFYFTIQIEDGRQFMAVELRVILTN